MVLKIEKSAFIATFLCLLIGTASAQERPLPEDPTANVKALVILEAKRQDELRTASDRFSAAAIANDQREFSAGVANLKEIILLRADYDEKLRIAEKGRIDAIRLVDVSNVAEAARKADQTAATLSKAVTDTAEALRKSGADSAEKLAALVSSTAAAALTTQQQQFTAVTAQIATLSARITTLEQAGAGSMGKSEGVSATIAVIGAAVGLLIGLLAIGVPLLIKRNYNGGVPRGG